MQVLKLRERWGEIGVELKDAINSTGDTKVKTLQDQNTLLLADINKYKAEATTATESLNKGMFEIGILSKLPAHAAGLTPRESLELAKMRGYTPERTDTGVVWKKNGDVLKDSATHAPLTEDKAIAHIWESEKWGVTAPPPPTGGRGAKQSTVTSPSGIKTFSEAEAYWKETNPDRGIASPEGMAFINEAAKQPDFNMDA